MRGHARVSLSREMLTRYLTLTRYLIEGLAVVLHMAVEGLTWVHDTTAVATSWCLQSEVEGW